MENIIASVPLDKTTAMVVSKGTDFTPDIKMTCDHWETPPVTIPLLNTEPNRIGVQFGEFTVVGKYAKSKKGRGALWLVRCSCGHYETRRVKAMNNPRNYGDSCALCRNAAYLKRREIYNRTGKHVDSRTIND